MGSPQWGHLTSNSNNVDAPSAPHLSFSPAATLGRGGAEAGWLSS